MPDQFIVTGSGRCGTHYMASLLTAAGVWCGHEKVFDSSGFTGWDGRRADSSWLAVPHLPVAGVPVVLLVRHPLSVVKSFVEIGFFGWQLSDVNAAPYHSVIRSFAPDVYDYAAEVDRALMCWYRLTVAALRHAEMLIRLESFDREQLARLLAWAGCGGDVDAFDRVGASNRHERLRHITGKTHDPAWSDHDPALADGCQTLAGALGYE